SLRVRAVERKTPTAKRKGDFSTFPILRVSPPPHSTLFSLAHPHPTHLSLTLLTQPTHHHGSHLRYHRQTPHQGFHHSPQGSVQEERRHRHARHQEDLPHLQAEPPAHP